MVPVQDLFQREEHSEARDNQDAGIKCIARCSKACRYHVKKRATNQRARGERHKWQ